MFHFIIDAITYCFSPTHNTVQCNYLHNCCIVLWDSIQFNVISFLLLPHAGDQKQGIFPLCVCVSQICNSSCLIISHLFLRWVSKTTGQTVHGQRALIYSPFTGTFLLFLNVFMSIMGFGFHSMSMRETGQGLLFSVYRWVNSSSEKHSRPQIPISSRSKLGLQMLIQFSFQSMCLASQFKKTFTLVLHTWFANLKGNKKIVSK